MWTAHSCFSAFWYRRNANVIQYCFCTTLLMKIAISVHQLLAYACVLSFVAKLLISDVTHCFSKGRLAKEDKSKGRKSCQYVFTTGCICQFSFNK